MSMLPEDRESLWLLVVAPTIWAAHFVASYATAAIWCAKVVGRDGALGGARIAIAIFTVLALAGIAWTGWIGWRRHRHGTATVPHEEDTAEDRHRLLGLATFLLSALSAVAVIYAAMAFVFIRSCE